MAVADPLLSRRHLVHGSLWVGLGFLGQQGIAVLRTLILARLLTPDDFGSVGIVMLTLFAGFMATELGVEIALIQRASLPPRYVETAWTVMLARGGGLFVVAQMIAPWIARSFDRPEVESLLRVGALSFVLVNVSAAPASLLLRELRFRRRVLFEAVRDGTGMAASVAFALWLGNAWALLLGLLLGQAVGAAGIWFLHEWRPRLAWDRPALADYWRFGRHLYAGGLLTYVVTRGDDITVGKLRGIGELGQYQVVFGIAEMLTRGLTEMVSKVVFPAYSRIAAEGRSLAEPFARVWLLLLLLLLPIAAVSAVFPAQLVIFFLGAQWAPAAVPFAVLVAAESLRALAAACGQLILAGGKPAYLSRIKVAEAACFALLIVPMTARWGMVGAAGCLVAVYGVSLLGHLTGAQCVEPAAARIVAHSWEPCLATGLLAWAAWRLGQGSGVPTGLWVLLWICLWGGYVWFRHARLLRMLRPAVNSK